LKSKSSLHRSVGILSFGRVGGGFMAKLAPATSSTGEG
jgi:hypothetical protein